MEKYESGNCTICTNFISVLHWHHTIPQALGGVNSLQIPLCADCHTVLHAHADAIVARTRTGKTIKKNFWPRHGDLERALPYLEILVTSIQNPLVTPEEKEYKLHAVVPREMHYALNLLKQELPGVTNLQQAVLYCIANTLKSRGLYNDRNAERREESGGQPQNTTTNLW